MAFRHPRPTILWDRPIFSASREYASFTTFRSWAFWWWDFIGGEYRTIGIRILGLEVSLTWIYMTEEEFEEFDQLRRDELSIDCDEEPIRAGTPEDAEWDDAEDGIF